MKKLLKEFGSPEFTLTPVKNHPFVDRNKRIGTHTMVAFLVINGVELAYTQEELSAIVLTVASGECKYEDLLCWLVEHQQG